MYRVVVLFIIAVTVVTAEELVAVVHLIPHNSSMRNITGDIMITQSMPNGPVKLSGQVNGLTEGLHGFHVHEKGNIQEGCLSTGAHFNPENNVHGAPENAVRHVGDLGNIRADANGEAVIDITDTVISLTGPNSIVGRAIVIHSNEDDLGKGNSTLSLSTGNAGDRWACGIIGIQSPKGSWSGSNPFTSPSMFIIATTLMIVTFHHLKY
ncbi:superoxide dismutase [Cu-Zn]-like isoform X1 [Vespa mandarinia]|uniref:superoxide dismutase [Cu-Zn]-like isoform X1 n=1 Tax=Vespa mandarinia TaxID=7446 RepID=UPI0016143663|nr:superoxide dismutase [Cu-Zn]-like isoform X1 [Vespa mandarinia]XP_035735851.1 superoxide dismutase [Cu-Zn]-like isoform X1 [Vespa mandarinia]XP_035735860.1 superoxide dismutase [Cu-Zn]-like isoform X1 [Vespa mandarinia]XP_035735870.1 superoxide dismutase [Cu-Zn]-like isoform X1 [Vespa mandarinia]XP_035735880.1 superoxide dismutase [Cu-Zn]-like isoform X1 [Vespa mandarinia]XP_035735889.1 superoxide dismutase [Cu-Zn]-like isoform X1 [Vespa mandarinia]